MYFSWSFLLIGKSSVIITPETKRSKIPPSKFYTKTELLSIFELNAHDSDFNTQSTQSSQSTLIADDLTRPLASDYTELMPVKSSGMSEDPSSFLNSYATITTENFGNFAARLSLDDTVGTFNATDIDIALGEYSYSIERPLEITPVV